MKVELYDLLPAVYRNRDYALGEPLRVLLDVLAEEVDEMRRDVDRLYDNWFIETCDEWVVPYIGDLLAAGGLHPGRPGVFSLRAFVANTLAYRRRKGTASVLANISQDVSGWAASATEFFQLLTTTQHLSHPRETTVWSLEGTDDPRIGTVGTLDIGKEQLLANLGTPFDTASRTIDIRAFTQYDGWHNIDRLGIFVWRLRSYPMAGVSPSPDADQVDGYHFHPLGLPAPLFVNPERQSGATERRREWEVPQPIRGDRLASDLERYYGAEKSLAIRLSGAELPASAIHVTSLADLPDFDDQGNPIPPGWQLPEEPSGEEPWAQVDPELGRLVVGPTGVVAGPEDIEVLYHYGFSADIGGGSYGRTVTPVGERATLIQVSRDAPLDEDSPFDPLTQALLAKPVAVEGEPPPCTIIRILDSEIYTLEFPMFISLVPGEELIIEAADGARPTVVLSGGASSGALVLVEDLGGAPPLSAASPRALFQLDGLLVAGKIQAEGALEFKVRHCTLLPNQPTIAIDPTVIRVPTLSYRLILDIERSIVAGLRIHADTQQVRVRDSVLGATANPDLETGPAVPAIRGTESDDQAGADVVLERVTVFGPVLTHAMSLASECIFADRVHVTNKQGGCMKYCYIDATADSLDPDMPVSRTPRRFRCQPDLALQEVQGDSQRAQIRAQLEPVFRSRLYGDPDYARLASTAPEEIRTGAENGSEMGVFSHLMEPQREANLREAVRRYLPFGLEMSVIYADEENNS